jgi:hypothetical protein
MASVWGHLAVIPTNRELIRFSLGRLLVITRVGVEKLSRRKFAEIASRQEALQTIFPSRLDIFHHPIFHFFQKNRLF